MITVYGAFPTRSFRVIWALEELGEDYRLRPVDLRNRMADAEFLALNPSGFLPAMRDGDVTMVDSIAMLEYLIARYDGGGLLAPAASDPRFPDYQQFLHLGESGLAAFLNVIVGSRFMAPEAEKTNWTVTALERRVEQAIGFVVSALGAKPYLAGDAFTLADISVSCALDMWKGALGKTIPDVLSAWRERVLARPACQRAQKALQS